MARKITSVVLLHALLGCSNVNPQTPILLSRILDNPDPILGTGESIRARGHLTRIDRTLYLFVSEEHALADNSSSAVPLLFNTYGAESFFEACYSNDVDVIGTLIRNEDGLLAIEEVQNIFWSGENQLAGTPCFDFEENQAIFFSNDGRDQ